MLLSPNDANSAHRRENPTNPFWQRFHIVALYCANAALLVMVVVLAVAVRRVRGRDLSLGVYCPSFLLFIYSGSDDLFNISKWLTLHVYAI